MGYFDTSSTKLVLPSDADYWVLIKNELTFGDVNYRNKRVLQLQSKGMTNPEQADAKWEIEQFGLATLERAIIGWNLSDVVDSSQIQNLRQTDAAFILEEVLKRNRVSEGGEAGKAVDSATTTKPSTAGRARSPK